MNKLVVNNFNGTLKKIGKEYSKIYEKHIYGFYDSYTRSFKCSKNYLIGCENEIKKYSKNAFQFIEAASIKFSDKELLLKILLSEELFTNKLKKNTHCSAIITNKGINAQNWDWNARFINSAQINHYNITNKCKILSYGFPGLFTSCGINSNGLSVMWTGAGYYPPLKPKIGVPTYALIFELLLLKDSKSALNYLKKTPNAGSFIFLINDKENNSCIIEGIPHKISIKEVIETEYRANFFINKEAIEASKQKLPSLKKCHSKKRIKALSKYNFDLPKKDQIIKIKEALSDKDVFVDCYKNMQTIDSLIANPNDLSLEYKRGFSNKWYKVKIT